MGLKEKILFPDLRIKNIYKVHRKYPPLMTAQLLRCEATRALIDVLANRKQWRDYLQFVAVFETSRAGFTFQI